MDRINTSTKAVDLFGAGKHGFKDGDLALGVVPTDLDAEWFNSVQEELLAVIEAASLVPSSANLAQLLAAIRSITGASTGLKSASGWTQLPSGIIIQWGRISYLGSDGAAGRVVSLPIAFPTAFLRGVGTDTGGGANAASVQSVGTSQLRGWGKTVGGTFSDTAIDFICIGD